MVSLVPPPLTKAERRERFMKKTRAEASYVFKYLIVTQIIVYLEAGSIPCLLDQLSVSLHLDATQQGALGGVVYLALSAASPLCAYFLHRFNPRLVLGLSLLANNMAVLMLALTPTGYSFSANMLILARAAVGFTQAFPCIYTPLWVDEYAPREKVAGWMSYLQGSVPMGVMLGYFAGTVSNWIVPESSTLIQTWRWPFLLQFLALLPINVAIFFVPTKHLVIRSDIDRDVVGSGGTQSSSDSSSDGCTDGETQMIEPASTTSVQKEEGVVVESSYRHEDDGEVHEEGAASSDSGIQPLHSGRGGFLSARGRSGFNLHSFLDDNVAGTPMSARSTTYHDEEDALLASASMYGMSNKRSFQQLLQNQQQQYHFSQCEETVGAASLRRTVVRPPSMRGTTLLDTVADEQENDDSTVSAPAAISTSPVNAKATGGEAVVSVSSPTVQEKTSPVSKPPAHVPPTYGALDRVVAPVSSPPTSPRINMLEASILEDEFEVYSQGAFSEGVYELLHMPVFCLIVFGLTTVYFVVTGVQYWSTIYMIKSLHASKYLVNALFVIVSGTGPILGVFFGGWLIDRSGGYIGVEQRARALGICMSLGLTAFFISAVATFFDNVFVTSGFLWLLLFFGGAILPACTGIFISVVPAEHRALASSFSVMVFNLFGYSLSPYLTGLIMEWVISKQGQPNSYFENCDEACAYRIGFRFCLCWSVWSVLCIGSAWHIASRQAEEARRVQHFYSAQRPAVAEEC